MADWRLRGQEEYLSGATLYKVTFPEFWERAYREKNRFYRSAQRCAKAYVERTGQLAEYLQDERIGRFWHDHCEFCWEKAQTDQEGVFFITGDCSRFICQACCLDFKEQFCWTLLPQEELQL